MLRWAKLNLKDVGDDVSLTIVMRVCRHLRTLQNAFSLNLTSLSFGEVRHEKTVPDSG